MRTFRSDNNAGLCPEALAALTDAADGHAVAYGDDEHTKAAVDAIRGALGVETRVWFVATGTAANTLAVAALTRSWEQVLCHRSSHWAEDESTAPERLTGCRTVPVAGEGGKVTVESLAEAAAQGRGDVHQPQPGVVTISNPTEFGTVYTPGEVRAICDWAHASGYRVHVDGARFANAVAALGCRPAELAGDAGVDALSFGGTKNGLAFGEAVCFFPQGDGARCAAADAAFPFLRKSSGHLLSKHRFVTAPFARTVGDGSWLRHAAHANAMARRLGDGLAAIGLAPRFPVQANGVFVALPGAVDAALRARGHGYYPFGDPAWRLVRLMCSFDTTEGEVDGLVEDVRVAGGVA